eukprot:TRINITY_DN3140_c1_g1_i6.p1 TRINITY_DN3140_c1_g1~~TRINITY_DN3140_c1_g1_i6.p1  ORF type:complete len:418 (+),score=112.62 TRINITY_DN3140_c1_g1_i6:171-1424(+)
MMMDQDDTSSRPSSSSGDSGSDADNERASGSSGDGSCSDEEEEDDGLTSSPMCSSSGGSGRDGSSRSGGSGGGGRENNNGSGGGEYVMMSSGRRVSSATQRLEMELDAGGFFFDDASGDGSGNGGSEDENEIERLSDLVYACQNVLWPHGLGIALGCETGQLNFPKRDAGGPQALHDLRRRREAEVVKGDRQRMAAFEEEDEEGYGGGVGGMGGNGVIEVTMGAQEKAQLWELAGYKDKGDESSPESGSGGDTKLRAAMATLENHHQQPSHTHNKSTTVNSTPAQQQQHTPFGSNFDLLASAAKELCDAAERKAQSFPTFGQVWSANLSRWDAGNPATVSPRTATAITPTITHTFLDHEGTLQMGLLMEEDEEKGEGLPITLVDGRLMRTGVIGAQSSSEESECEEVGTDVIMHKWA